MRQSTLFFLILSTVFSSVCANNLHNPEQYQDIIINGKLIKPGTRDCQIRYHALEKILSQFKRKFTVLDLGAAQGAFGFSIAHDYNAVVTMIEGGYVHDNERGDELLDLCKKNTELNNIIYLKKHMTVEDLETLSQCEHFDVVLALNVVHHFKDKWQRALHAIFNLGDHVIIEVPPANDHLFAKNTMIRECNKFLEKKGGTILVETPRHTDPTALSPMRWYHHNKIDITLKYWLLPTYSIDPRTSYEIVSTFGFKLFIKRSRKNTIVRMWRPGINLVTFKMLNGQWPSKESIQQSIKNIKYAEAHDDLLPWNMILQGKKIKTIDNDGEYSLDPNLCLQKSLEFALLNTPKELKSFFERTMVELSSKGRVL